MEQAGYPLRGLSWSGALKGQSPDHLSPCSQEAEEPKAAHIALSGFPTSCPYSLYPK